MAVTNRKEITQLMKWLVWVSDNAGIYVRAHRVIETDDTVSFVRERSDIDEVVAKYNLKEIRYSLVE